MVDPALTEIAKKELDDAIRVREERLTTRRVKTDRDAGPEPSVP